VCRERRQPVSKRRGAIAVLLRPPPLRRPQQRAPSSLSRSQSLSPLSLLPSASDKSTPGSDRIALIIISPSGYCCCCCRARFGAPSSRLVFFSARYSLFCSGSGRILPRSCLLYTKWLSIVAPCVRTLAIIYLCSAILVDLWFKKKRQSSQRDKGEGEDLHGVLDNRKYL
jgi:hypothetical protein